MIDMDTHFHNWVGNKLLTEAGTRYSIEVNFRSTAKEVKEHFAKLVLGYIMAAMKQHNYHVKHVYTVKPHRIIISNKQWEDGEWCGIVSYNEEQDCFMFSEGVYSKMRETCSVSKTEKCAGNSAAEVTREVINKMHQLKQRPLKHGVPLKPALKKRGPQK